HGKSGQDFPPHVSAHSETELKNRSTKFQFSCNNETLKSPPCPRKTTQTLMTNLSKAEHDTNILLLCLFSFHVWPDQLSSLPSDITFEICTSSSSSSPPPPPPPPPPSSSATAPSTTAMRSSEETTFNEGNTTDSTYVKSERVVSGMHFLTDREEDRGDLLLPKSESGEAEPEVRKQVGWSAAFDTAPAGSAPAVPPGFVRRTSTRRRRSLSPRPRGDRTNRNGQNTRRPLRKLASPRI
ncbi:unnamed protein product, partial [Heterotrigona itama]